MKDVSPLYNSRITKTYIEFLKKNYPDLDINQLLNSASIFSYEVDDPAHWFTQQQVDQFQKSLIERTGNPNIAREAGQYVTSHDGMGAVKQYVLGLMNLSSVYLLMGKVYPWMSRGAYVSAKKLGPEKIEVISIPYPGVQEKPYQCDNRIGFFEGIAKLFTNNLAKVEQISCFHKGDKACHYIITWKGSHAFFWKRFRNFSFLFSIFFPFISFFFLPLASWSNLTLLCFLLTLLIISYSEHLEKKELGITVETQGTLRKTLCMR